MTITAIEAVQAEYDLWREGCRSKEPELTAGDVACLINPGLCEESYRLRERKALVSRTRRQLVAGVAAGLLGTSEGNHDVTLWDDNS